MNMMWLYIFLSLFFMIYNLEVIPTKPEIKYVNQKYIKRASINIRRKNRVSPYHFNVFGELLHAWGNNLTLGFESFEYLGGNYIPILLRMENGLCNFYSEPIIGRMLIDQMPKNLSICPVAAGFYSVPNLLIRMDKFPVDLPFTYDAIEVRGRCDIYGYVTATKEPVANISIYGIAIQKPRNRQKN